MELGEGGLEEVEGSKLEIDSTRRDVVRLPVRGGEDVEYDEGDVEGCSGRGRVGKSSVVLQSQVLVPNPPHHISSTRDRAQLNTHLIQ